jgi:protein TonB
VAIALGAAALAVLIGGGVLFVLVVLHRAPAAAQELVGSALPPGWQPGGGLGVGRPPPTPPGAPAPPTAAAPAAPHAEPYDSHPETPADEPAPEAGAPIETPPEASAEAPPTEAAADAPGYEPPRLVSLPRPEYPPLELRFGREGTVNLQVVVDADGHVISAEPVGERLGIGFESAARRAAFRARFEPARRNGQPVAGETRIAIRFALH